jgi:hypothetical protein
MSTQSPGYFYDYQQSGVGVGYMEGQGYGNDYLLAPPSQQWMAPNRQMHDYYNSGMNPGNVNGNGVMVQVPVPMAMSSSQGPLDTFNANPYYSQGMYPQNMIPGMAQPIHSNYVGMPQHQMFGQSQAMSSLQGLRPNNGPTLDPSEFPPLR